MQESFKAFHISMAKVALVAGAKQIRTPHIQDSQHRFRGVHNLFVVDGSVLPTSLRLNPSQTIYSLANRARAFVGEAV